MGGNPQWLCTAEITVIPSAFTAKLPRLHRYDKRGDQGREEAKGGSRLVEVDGRLISSAFSCIYIIYFFLLHMVFFLLYFFFQHGAFCSFLSTSKKLQDEECFFLLFCVQRKTFQ